MTNPDDPRLLRLAEEDNVCAVRSAVRPGESIRIAGVEYPVAAEIPTGHKIAVRPIAAGAKVVKYGAPIGSATRAIQPGDYVHTHNLKSDYLPTYTRQSGGHHLD